MKVNQIFIYKITNTTNKSQNFLKSNLFKEKSEYLAKKYIRIHF
jgi:hypothetical protein